MQSDMKKAHISSSREKHGNNKKIAKLLIINFLAIRSVGITAL